MTRTASVLLAAVFCFTLAQSAGAVVLGPNVFTHTGTDTQDTTRLNIDLVTGTTLQPGTYGIDSATFRINAANTDAQAFLATVSGEGGSGSETYTVIAAAPDRTFTTTGTQTVTFTGVTFTLTSPTTVYPGFTNVSGTNGVGEDDGAPALGGRNPHFNPGGPVSVGTMIQEFAVQNPNNGNGASNGSAAGQIGSSNAYVLNRVYDYAIEVNPIPEPACLGLLTLGALGMLVRRRVS
jgi:hypothetical protein